MHPDSFETNTDYWEDEVSNKMFSTLRECKQRVKQNDSTEKIAFLEKLIKEELKERKPPKPFVPKSKKFALIATS